MDKNKTISRIIREIRSLIIIVLIALTLKVTIVEAYIVPTGSMENTIMTGDFLIGNRFVYGMRTPDWIGIPYTDIGFNIPFVKFPRFREPKQGDVLIFKYPRDTYHKYVKRCIGLPGDTVEIREREVFVNGIQFKLPENGKFIGKMLPKEYRQAGIFYSGEGNKDHMPPVAVPRKGDVIPVTPENSQLLIQLMVLDGRDVALKSGNREFRFTIINPDDILRRKEIDPYFQPEKARKALKHYYKPYVSLSPTGQLYQIQTDGNLITPWNIPVRGEVELYLDGDPIRNLTEYVVAQDYYWVMGDNRDNSLDSRFWGFVPDKYLLGEALLTYFSLDLDTWLPRLGRIGTVIR